MKERFQKQTQLLRVLLLAATTSLFYFLYKYKDPIMIHQKLYKHLPDINDNALLNTIGCVIPNYTKNFNFKEIKTKKSCEKRLITAKKTNKGITFFIDHKQIKGLSHGEYRCCYQFVTRSTAKGKEDTAIEYSSCIKFQNGTTINFQHEIISVKCTAKRNKKETIIYDDTYMFVNKINLQSTKTPKRPWKWNVLVLGMDTMSRKRVMDSMPKSFHYMKRNEWLDFQGYNKVGYNTYPNLMAILTGLEQSKIYSACPNGMDKCNDLFTWGKYSSYGYMTAYGEDNLECPDTFRNYKGFRDPPTNHYMRPLFLTGETTSGYLTCTKKLSSGEHLLNYAYDFANSYKEYNYFGFFWMNSFSHGLDRKPEHIDIKIMEFFEALNKTHHLENTFIIFLGDHGVRYGKMRYEIEGFYEERLPMLFISVPTLFKQSNNMQYKNALVNQNRLISPYDLHVTLKDILKMSGVTDMKTEVTWCTQCSSLFVKKSPKRNCFEAGIAEKWCSCHNAVNIHDYSKAKSAINTYAKALSEKVRQIKTKPCTICREVTLKSIIRVHTFTKSKKSFYIIAVSMKPINTIFEGIIGLNNNGSYFVLDSNIISEWQQRGQCALRFYEKTLCVCDKVKKCKNS